MELIKSFLTEKTADISVSFIGAFFGFVFALILQRMLDFFRDKRRKQQLFNSMKDELENLKYELNKVIDCNDPYFRYQYSVWETAKSSGELILISREKCFKTLSEIYSKIYFADLIEQSYFDLYISRLKNDSTSITSLMNEFDRTRKEEKKKIIDEITSFIDNYEKYKLCRFRRKFTAN